MKIFYKRAMVCLLFLLANNVKAQTRIFEILTNSGFRKSIVAYDVSTQMITPAYNLYTTYGNLSTQNFYCTADYYRGKYYFIATSDTACDYRLFIYDIFSNTIRDVPLLSVFGDLEYDIFNDRVLINNASNLYSYNPNNDSISLLFSVPQTSGLFYGTTRAYDPFLEYYFYNFLDSNSISRSLLIDVNTGAIVSNTIIGASSIPLMTVYDIKTLKYYSVLGNGDVVAIDPTTTAQTYITTIPDWLGLYNQEQPVFNFTNGLFMIPYYNSQHINRLVTIDVVNGNTISNVPFIPADFNKLFSKFSPVIKIRGNHIIASYGSSYQWYLNGIPIPSANGQTIPIGAPGFYSVQETFPDGSVATSNSIEITVLGIEQLANSANQITIYPNPATTQFHISAAKEVKEFNVSIYAMTGKEVMSVRTSEIVSTAELPAGIYFGTASTEKERIGQFRLVVVK